MKKSILNLGKLIPEKSQQLIFGGTGTNECGYGTCSNDMICYYGSNGTYCGNYDPNSLEVAPPEHGMPRYGDGG